MLLEEAHTLEEGIGCALLNAGQQVGREFPFLLVLAGTPSLRSHLNAMNAYFWNRAARRPTHWVNFTEQLNRNLLSGRYEHTKSDSPHPVLG